MNNKITLDGAVKKLESFEYPSELCEVVSRFFKYVCAIFSDLDFGVLLVGSTARGELSWVIHSDKVRLFSDIEFLVAIPAKNKIKELLLSQKIMQLESEYDFGELFHIDYTVITWDKLARLDKKFFTFESKQCGIEFGDRSICSELPEVNRSNLNWKELNEVLLHRLNSIMHSIPASLFDSAMMEEEQRTFALNLAKNTLDLTTWLHPYETDSLVAGFTARIASWDQGFLERQQLGNYFSIDDVGYIESCLALRKSPYSPVDVGSMLDQTLLLYVKGISYCKAMNEIDEKKSISGILPSIKLFDEYRVRQRISQAISLLVNISEVGAIKFFRNTVCVRKGVAANFCRNMLLAANNYVKDDGSSQQYLNQARDELFRLTKEKDLAGEDFVNTWFNMREYFKNYQDISHNF